MKGGGTGGFLLLIIGAVGVIGFLTGQLPRWLNALFSPGTPTSLGGAPGTASSGTTVAPPPVPSSNQRSA